MERNDKQLIFDYLVGDESALHELVRRYLKALYNFVYRLTNNTEDAEDITQEIFIKVWKNIKQYDQNYSVKTWLFAIARNTTIDWLRKKRDLVFSDFETSEGENILLDTLTDPMPLSDEIMARAEDKKFLDHALSKLPLMYREVIVLRYQDGLTFNEIGNVVGKPLDTVKSQHRRALIALRKLLTELR